MKKRELRTDYLGMKIAPTVKESIRKAAKAQGRSMANYLLQLHKQAQEVAK